MGTIVTRDGGALAAASAEGARRHLDSAVDLPQLVDSFGRRHTYLRVSLTERCNLRCSYCMPAEGVRLRPRDEILSFEEIERVVRLLVRMGVRKVRLTGGEPLVRRGVERLVANIVATPGIEVVAMTTNGVLLAAHAERLRLSGLRHLNVSLDSLQPQRFRDITRRDSFAEVWAGIEAAIAAGFVPLKLNVVVMAGVNDDELLDFVELARRAPINVRFIEYMPFKGNGWSTAIMVSYARMREIVARRYDLRPLPSAAAAVAEDFTIAGWPGSVSFIASMTRSFCEGCDRLRLLADGAIKSCLFYRPEASVRRALREGDSDDEIESIIRGAVSRKPAGHAPMEELVRLVDRSMIEIGG